MFFDLVSGFRDDVEAGSGLFPEQGVVGRESFLIRLQDVIVDGALTRGVVTVYHTVQQWQHRLLQSNSDTSFLPSIANSAVLLQTRLSSKAMFTPIGPEIHLNFYTTDTGAWCE